MKDLRSALAFAQSIVVALVTATANGAGVDLAGFEGALFKVDLGTFAGTTPTATVQFEESDLLGSGYTLIAPGDLASGAQPVQITPSTDNTIIEEGYLGSKQFVRIAISAISGAGASLPCSGTVVKGFGRHQPS